MLVLTAFIYYWFFLLAYILWHISLLNILIIFYTLYLDLYLNIRYDSYIESRTRAIVTYQSFYRLVYSHSLVTKKMNIYNVTDSSSSLQKSTIFVSEYAFSLIDANGDIQYLAASFRSFPSTEDWADWLSGWFNCGYSFLSQPSLIRIV